MNIKKISIILLILCIIPGIMINVSAVDEKELEVILTVPEEADQGTVEILLTVKQLPDSEDPITSISGNINFDIGQMTPVGSGRNGNVEFASDAAGDWDFELCVYGINEDNTAYINFYIINLNAFEEPVKEGYVFKFTVNTDSTYVKGQYLDIKLTDIEYTPGFENPIKGTPLNENNTGSGNSNDSGDDISVSEQDKSGDPEKKENTNKIIGIVIIAAVILIIAAAAVFYVKKKNKSNKNFGRKEE